MEVSLIPCLPCVPHGGFTLPHIAKDEMLSDSAGVTLVLSPRLETVIVCIPGCRLRHQCQ